MDSRSTPKSATIESQKRKRDAMVRVDDALLAQLMSMGFPEVRVGASILLLSLQDSLLPCSEMELLKGRIVRSRMPARLVV